jgi:NAD(P)H dehydrogenase (quinone)
MFAITGITGQVGGEVARNLLTGRQTVRGQVRDVNKAKVGAERGCELVAADINDAAALTAAFEGVDGVFVLVPPNFDPSPDFQEARAIAGTLNRVLDSARPRWRDQMHLNPDHLLVASDRSRLLRICHLPSWDLI